MKKGCWIGLVLMVVLVLAVAMTIRRHLPLSEDRASSADATQDRVAAQEQVAQPEVSGLNAAGAPPPPGILIQAVPLQAAAPTPAAISAGIEGLAFRVGYPLLIDAPRVGGLAATERFVYVASYDPQKKAAYLIQLRRPQHTIAQIRKVDRDGRYQLGGIHMGQPLLWAPLAGEGLGASTTILAIDPTYLEVRDSYVVEDRIVAVAQGSNGRIYGLNDDSSLIYEWLPNGQELRKVPNQSGARYHDMEAIGGSLVCAGIGPDGGVIDVFDVNSLSVLRRRRANARAASGQLVTSRAFAYHGGTFMFVPGEGSKPTLMTYVLDGVSLADYIPSVNP